MSQDPAPASAPKAGASSRRPNGVEGRERAYDRFVEGNLRRNYFAHFTHGMLGMTGFRLIFAPTFVPAYLHMLTGSALFVGIGQALIQAGAIASPIMGAAQIEHRRHVMPAAMTIGVLMRIQLLGLALAGWFLTGSLLLAATFLFLFLFGFFLGSQRVAFQVVLAKVIPIRLRGRLQAWRNLAGGAIAAGLSWWAGVYLIGPNVFGNGYATTFMVAFLLTSAGLATLYFFMREPGSPTVREPMPFLQRLKEFPVLLADRDYRNFLIALVFATMGRIAIPFCIILAGRRMDIDGATIGLLSLAFLGADTLTNLIWGTLGDKHGFRFTFIGTVALWLISLAGMLFASAPWHFLLAFFGLGAAMSGNMMSVTTLVLEFGHRDDIPMRLALSTTAETTIATIGPILGGVVAAVFGLVPVFLISIIALAIALTVLVVAVREPRHL
ncbi:MFS transporter [Maricaulis parjimensis]|uniref:MFS transporter n=1 Tax=Maricaulis parjimensis TaxID=144023 RepID=UPI001EEDE094|nr:MFS transporter [Maricaulis parjimensis]